MRAREGRRQERSPACLILLYSRAYCLQCTRISVHVNLPNSLQGKAPRHGLSLAMECWWNCMGSKMCQE